MTSALSRQRLRSGGAPATGCVATRAPPRSASTLPSCAVTWPRSAASSSPGRSGSSSTACWSWWWPRGSACWPSSPSAPSRPSSTGVCRRRNCAPWATPRRGRSRSCSAGWTGAAETRLAAEEEVAATAASAASAATTAAQGTSEAAMEAVGDGEAASAAVDRMSYLLLRPAERRPVLSTC